MYSDWEDMVFVVYIDVSRSVRSKPEFKECYIKDKICFVTQGQVMNQGEARQFCAKLPKKSVLPTISNDSRLRAFDDLLGKAQHVTNNQPVWLDIHRTGSTPLLFL